MPNSTKKSAKKDLERTRSYAIIIYPDSANSKWLEILERTCIPCAISPLHDKDLENDGTPKKPHYHVLFKFENKKSLKQIFEICELLGAPKYAETIQHIKGYYDYLTHKHNPQKAQYSETEIIHLNGFDINEYKSLRELQAEDRQTLKDIQKFIKKTSLELYSDLLDYCMEHNDKWYELLTTKYTYVMRSYMKSRSYGNRKN